MNKTNDYRDISLSKKIFFSLFTILIVAGIVLSVISVKLNLGDAFAWLKNIGSFPFITISLIFIMSLVFVRLNKKSIIYMLSMLCVMAIFVLSSLSFVNENIEASLLQDLCLYLLCASQAVLIIYTVWMDKGAGLKCLELGIRVALSLALYFLLTELVPEHFDFRRAVYMIYALNSIITMVVLCFHFKTNYLSIIGVLLMLAGTVFIFLITTSLFTLPTIFVDIFVVYQGSFALFAFGAYLVATDGVFANNMIARAGDI